MKLGTFVLGGLAGAAVVMMMSRNGTMSAVANGFGQMVRRQANQWKETAMEKGMNVKFGEGLFGNANGKNQASGPNRTSDRSGGLDRVEHLASKDPKVKREVNQILEESGQHHI